MSDVRRAAPTRPDSPRRTPAELSGIVAVLTGPSGPTSRFPISERRVEVDAITDLLMHSTTPGIDIVRAEQVAWAVAAGCLGEQHLWRDLGLPNRAALRILLEHYFEPLAADNVMDMRWKKFIYRRLCRWGGFQTCKAPSCGACSSYEECFGEPS